MGYLSRSVKKGIITIFNGAYAVKQNMKLKDNFIWILTNNKCNRVMAENYGTQKLPWVSSRHCGALTTKLPINVLCFLYNKRNVIHLTCVRGVHINMYTTAYAQRMLFNRVQVSKKCVMTSIVWVTHLGSNVFGMESKRQRSTRM